VPVHFFFVAISQRGATGAEATGSKVMLPQAFTSSAMIQEQALSDARPFRSSVQAEPETDEAAID